MMAGTPNGSDATPIVAGAGHRRARRRHCRPPRWSRAATA